MDLMNDLNAQQRQAVTAGLGQILVLAGPGSGKTRVLTRRIAYLIQAMGVRPYNILAVTFTNKAARQMEARLETMLGQRNDGLWLGTFHAVCARLLRREAGYLPFNASFVIMDADDQETLVRRALKDLNINEKQFKPSGMHAAISNAKNNLLQPKDVPVQSYRDEVVRRIYQRYQELLQASNAVDFDDLLFCTVQLLRDNPEVRERYARRFEHILVDEFQDTNTAQYELLGLLASHHRNIFVVGDEDQSIYRWRGADYRNVLRFEEDYRDCQKVLLEQNYRSTQTVLDAARAVIDRNTHRTPKRLTSARKENGERILLYEAVDDHAEAAYVVESIQQLMTAGKVRGGEIAVMYRTNAQSRLLEEAFLRAGLAYRLVGAQRFYGRREVKDMIAFLRLAQNPADEISLSRVINVPPRGIGDKTLVTLQMVAQRAGVSSGVVMLDLGQKGLESPYYKDFSGRGAAVLADFGGLMNTWQAGVLAEMPLPALFDRILSDSGYRAYIEDESEEGEDRWENVEELRRLAYEYQERGLLAFLENLALVSDQDTLPEQLDAPTLLTLHAAKGLEFAHVFIPGLDEGLLPHSRSRDDPEEMAEERRLFYVGLTRAKNRLYLVRSERRSSYGSFEDSEPSRFLDDIPADLIQRKGGGFRSALHGGASDRYGAGGENRFGGSRSRSDRWESGPSTFAQRTQYTPPPARPAPVVTPRYPAGTRVSHASWGEGLVVDSRIQDGDETVDVFFDSVGFKRLAASLAKLEIIQK